MDCIAPPDTHTDCNDPSPSNPTLVITGAAGFVGQRLLNRLDPDSFGRVVALSRRQPGTTLLGRPTFAWIHADLFEPASYEPALAGADVVLHLAAVTGKARRRAYSETNVRGTQLLLDACRRQGVRSFVFVSSIAARFKRIQRYYYAQSKREAEAAVAASGLSYAIVRPGPVIGAASPIFHAFRTLARAKLLPLFGGGKALIQPIDVDDLADFLVQLVRTSPPPNETVEVGGPEIISIKAFIQRIRRALGRGGAWTIPLPLRPIERLLGWLEPWFFPLLPMTAGQLASFGEDGTIADNEICRRSADRHKTIDEMIASALAGSDGSQVPAHEPVASGV